MITVHHLNHSRSQRVLWLLEELDVPYEIRHYLRDAVTLRAPAELAAVHPLGKSPVISDGDIVVAETGAIIEYLIGTYGNGRLCPPAGSEARRRYTYWLHFAEGTLMPPLVMRLVLDRVAESPLPAEAKPVAEAIVGRIRSSYLDPLNDGHFAFLETELGRSTWFAGEEFTAADIQMSFPIEARGARVGFGDTQPRLAAFLNRIAARPAYRRALERGGPYAYARPEARPQP
jgi:glutathione S-transferase